MKKVSIVTGTRADFGILSPLIKKIEENNKFELELIVTAMHLSPEFGNTVNDIQERGFTISKKIECLLSSDSPVGISKSLGLAVIGFADAFEELKPDLVLLLGDRTEILAAATAATIANIPLGHIHGGETTEGAYDESIRHAITKMSYLHFTSTEAYRKRVIQLGEAPERVFNVGALGVDSIKKMQLLTKENFEDSIGLQLGERNILITYHPVTLENNAAEAQFTAILEALDSFPNIRLIFTHANSDKEGRIINEMIEEYVALNSERAVAFKSLGQLRYLSALQFIDAVLGNSSSGILEVPFFRVPTINVGDRQKGRLAPRSVIQCSPQKEAILAAIDKAFDPEFKKEIENQEQIYGRGDASEQILDIISEVRVENLKKPFFDVNFSL